MDPRNIFKIRIFNEIRTIAVTTKGNSMRKIGIFLGFIFNCTMFSFASYAWEGPFTIKEIQYHTGSAGASDRGLILVNDANNVFWYTAATPGYSFEDMKVFLSVAMTAQAQGKRLTFLSEKIGTTPNRNFMKVSLVD